MSLQQLSRQWVRFGLSSNISGGQFSQFAKRFFVSSSVLRQEQDPEPVPLSRLSDSFNDGTSITYLEELERRYYKDPKSVDKTWASFFNSLDQGVSPVTVAEAFHAYQSGTSAVSPLQMASTSNQTIDESMKLLLLIRAYQVMGHSAAKLDPLGLDLKDYPEELQPEFYGFTEKDWDRDFYIGVWPGRGGFLEEERPVRQMRELINALRKTYCGNMGIEYMHISDGRKCSWLRNKLEVYNQAIPSKPQKLAMYDRLVWSEHFESFLASKFTAAKRFGLEGAETLIPGMKALIDKAADLEVSAISIGMPHRGRLNVLANVVRKPLSQIFHEFVGSAPIQVKGEFFGTGDVKYHLGTSFNRPTAGETGRDIQLSLLANPSHLEAVNTVVLGKIRAKQHFSGDSARHNSMGLLLHGDGSFSGQGIVYETLDMSQLPDYTVGGTVHIVLNNQVAFTTDPSKSRSSPYCTDVARSLEAPIFHVNGDDVEAVCRACELAVEYRQKFKSDTVVDIVCYRRHGHNEIDEPMFTQPNKYKVIKQMPSSRKIYEDKLIADESASSDELKVIRDKCNTIMESEYQDRDSYVPTKRDWLANHWDGFLSPAQQAKIRNTGVSMETLKRVGLAITEIPEGFNPHKQISKVYQARRAMITEEDGNGMVDWGMAEALAFGTLMAEQNAVRLSGQDVERGTFSHRHAVIHDQVTGKSYVPLRNVSVSSTGSAPAPSADFTVCNSSLSEFGVLGFEVGYSIADPNQLVLWEAQFGDFANGAQIIFDQFIAAGESKWLRQSGLVCLLPHGYDGQGPEHSSGRVERFLQMVDENPYELPDIDEKQWFSGGHLGSQTQNVNMQIVNCTTPVNYFHVLRRQVHRQFRKPLIVMSPKNLLRHPACKSAFFEFDDLPDEHLIQGVRFKRVIMDTSSTDRSPRPQPQDHVKRLVLCTGKIYYELEAEREKLGQQDQVAIVRVEQLSPFPFDLIMRELRRYPNAEVAWCQEEPMNMGAYSHIKPRVQTCMKKLQHTNMDIKYVGRVPSASPATGFLSVHQEEQAEILHNAMALG